jgi:hypothetical protein
LILPMDIFSENHGYRLSAPSQRSSYNYMGI